MVDGQPIGHSGRKGKKRKGKGGENKVIRETRGGAKAIFTRNGDNQSCRNAEGLKTGLGGKGSGGKFF